MDSKTKKKVGTFQLNKAEPIHGWYPYIEGYSSRLVADELDALESENIHTIYDPFGGVGTTPLAAVQRGYRAFYSETNPFMQGVIEAKINCVKRLADAGTRADGLRKFRQRLSGRSVQLALAAPAWDGFEKFYDGAVLADLLRIKHEIAAVKDPDTRALLMLALSAIAVDCSAMVRRGDMRYATPKEKDPAHINAEALFFAKLDAMIADIETAGPSVLRFAEKLCDDARDDCAEDMIDCVITSPPYLNGTNYIRNTKLELKLNDYIVSEDDLPSLHSKGIAAGINNISSRRGETPVLPVVQPYLERLAPAAYDKRIVEMVKDYFYDMDTVIEKLSHVMRDGGIFIMDIGDSQYAGVHIPTHEILSAVCAGHGFEKYGETVLRERRSKNGMILSQRILRFKLKKKSTDAEIFKRQAELFIRDLPYRAAPFAGRNWGHPWHSLCSYHGKLKPSVAHFLIERFTRENDVVLDPLCGCGTIPFEACLQGRTGIGNDLSELAYVVTKAKLERAEERDCLAVLQALREYIGRTLHSPETAAAAENFADFGFNGSLRDYFHPDTFREIVCAREFFVRKMPRLTSAEAMVFSALLHVLHGNRPYALSRNSHPLTPYAPRGEFIYKNVAEHIGEKLRLAYRDGDFSDYRTGRAIFGDYANIGMNGQADYIICSPPFADSMRFYMQNWMRLWLCGWGPEQFASAGERFLDAKQTKDFGVYASFFTMCAAALKPRGKLILHLGKTKKTDMAKELSVYAKELFDEIYRGCENVTELEKHGVKDKGATVEHQFLFLIKK